MKRIGLCAALLASACQPHSQPHSQLGELAAVPSCSREIVPPPTLATAPSWRRTPFAVEPKGVYTFHHPLDSNAKQPTALDIAADLKLAPGDYLGLQSFGRWYWGSDTGPGGPTSNSLGAVFVDAAGHFLAPAKSGQEQPFVSQPTYYGNIAADIAEDFRVPDDAETIVRIPAGAKRVLLAVGDSAYGDNSVAGEFGVMVFEPNRPSAEPSSFEASATAQADAAAPLFEQAQLQSMLALDFPEAESFSVSPFAGQGGADVEAQWRGNYGGGWLPLRSTYSGQRTNGRHWGWDLFSPKGTPLVAPVWPSLMIVPNKSVTFGNTVAFGFKVRGRKYLIGYAHLESVAGAGRSIAGPELVGYSGCTGSSVESTGCGARYEAGKVRGTRNDHVHVGLYNDQVLNPVDGQDCNPARFLPWRIG